MGNFIRMPIVTTGLILYLDGANSKCYPGTGTAVTDLSGQKNNGVLTNSPGYITTNGGGFFFNGPANANSTYILGANIPFTTLNGGYTVMSFHYLSNTSSYPTIFAVGKSPGSNAAPINIGYVGATGKIQSYQINTGSTTQTTLTPVTLNQFCCVTATWDGLTVNGTVKYYINGVLQITQTTQGALSLDTGITTYPYYVGNRGTFDIPFMGNIYNVMMYNRPLTQTEITQNYNATKARFGL